MQKTLFTIIIASLFLSCGRTGEEKNGTKGEDTVTQTDVPLSKLDALEQALDEDRAEKKESKLVFKANGSEPGWFAEFFNHKLRLLVDYGKDSLLLDEEFEKLDNETDYSNSYTFNSKGKETKLDIHIENKPCTNEAGNKLSRTVTITYQGKIYKGCGEFVK